MPRQRRGIRGDVGIAPYNRLPYPCLVLTLSFRASPQTGVGIRPPRPQARNPLPPLCEAAQCSHWVVRRSVAEVAKPKVLTEGEICRGSAVAYGAMWASPPTSVYRASALFFLCHSEGAPQGYLLRGAKRPWESAIF